MIQEPDAIASGAPDPPRSGPAPDPERVQPWLSNRPSQGGGALRPGRREPWAFWLFQLGVVFHGWKSYGTEPWFTWSQIEELLTRALAQL